MPCSPPGFGDGPWDSPASSAGRVSGLGTEAASPEGSNLSHLPGQDESSAQPGHPLSRRTPPHDFYTRSTGLIRTTRPTPAKLSSKSRSIFLPPFSARKAFDHERSAPRPSRTLKPAQPQVDLPAFRGGTSPRSTPMKHPGRPTTPTSRRFSDFRTALMRPWLVCLILSPSRKEERKTPTGLAR